MFHVPDYQQNLSLRLSEALDDIGVNERMVLNRRRTKLLEETMSTVTVRPTCNTSLYQFGSLSEGTTTLGLGSDSDRLICFHKYNVIQDFAEWKHGFKNLLMIQNDYTLPGYCLLQAIRDDVPLPATHVLEQQYIRSENGRELVKNTVFRDFMPADHEQHGPSWAQQGGPGFSDTDTVHAYHCNSWPCEARTWLHRQGIGRWPSADMKRFAENNGCFVVPVGSKVSQNPELEWRISTSQAERCLMFSLNITQIRCYVLMKMILKTFLQHAGEGQISSFMCKTVLLHCIENTHSNVWQENNLFTCLSCCLHVLYTCLQQENCPHFIIPGNNLMAGQFSSEVKGILLDRMLHIMQSEGQALLGVHIDDLGQRLQIKLNMLHQILEIIPSKKESGLHISAELLLNISVTIARYNNNIFSKTNQYSSATVVQYLFQVLYYTMSYRKGSELEQRAASLLAPVLSSTLGTVTASLNIQTNNTVSSEALIWLSAGLNSDVTSSSLKLASVFYSVKNMVNTEFTLKTVEEYSDFQNVEPICGCYDYCKFTVKRMFREVAYYQKELAVRSVCAFCVRFIPAEIQCVPHELQYEMFRSTEDDLLYRDRVMDIWMDWAVVDSLPYLYFLQYKTYGHLQKFDDQQQALINLVRTIETERNLGHRETALNLLGQCMEQENQPHNALLCYIISLKVRERNNAARLHICRLLARLHNAEHEVIQQ